MSNLAFSVEHLFDALFIMQFSRYWLQAVYLPLISNAIPRL